MATEWTAPSVARVEPDLIAGERQSLEQWLEFHRETLLMKCAGLSAEQLKARPVPPSSLSLLGLVRHMTEVEQWWFRMHAGTEQIEFAYSTEPYETADFEEIDGADAEADLDRFRSELAAARAAVMEKGLDDVVASRGHHADKTRDIRWIYLHMIEEYARHNGHADLIRECIDGVVGD
jgi:uncharacterized damage-inducible protein DinB